jgi:two-component system chemotaxis response regulator CheB
VLKKIKKNIRVLIVDDSAVVRKVLTRELSRYEGIEVVGTAVDPYVARDKIVNLKPDVITLDLEMPRMDGLTFLSKLMKYFPVPVIVLSSLTPKNSKTALKALQLGAVDVLAKPGSSYSTKNVSEDLARAIYTASIVDVKVNTSLTVTTIPVNANKRLLDKTTHKVVAIGASTGGTKAVEVVLRGFPASFPGVVVVQHMPEKFTATFAQRLNDVCSMEVKEAKSNDFVVPGQVLIAPGNYHTIIVGNGGEYMVKLKGGPRVHFQRPSVDVMFNSVASSAGKNAVGVILTGMGADGAQGLLQMRESGSRTLAQDEETCVVFGMPKEAIKIKAVEKTVPLHQMASEVAKVLH